MGAANFDNGFEFLGLFCYRISKFFQCWQESLVDFYGCSNVHGCWEPFPSRQNTFSEKERKTSYESLDDCDKLQ